MFSHVCAGGAGDEGGKSTTAVGRAVWGVANAVAPALTEGDDGSTDETFRCWFCCCGSQHQQQQNCCND